jgi:hypothetical protein
MSAFVVEDAVINGILSWIEGNMHKLEFCYIERVIVKAGYKVQDSRDEWRRLADDMFSTNCVAVEQRYGVGEAQKFRPLDFQYNPSTCEPSKFQALKSLECWLYQCSEGDVPETSEIYKLMDSVRDAIARGIVHQTREYEEAGW